MSVLDGLDEGRLSRVDRLSRGSGREVGFVRCGGSVSELRVGSVDEVRLPRCDVEGEGNVSVHSHNPPDGGRWRDDALRYPSMGDWRADESVDDICIVRRGEVRCFRREWRGNPNAKAGDEVDELPGEVQDCVRDYRKRFERYGWNPPDDVFREAVNDLRVCVGEASMIDRRDV